MDVHRPIYFRHGNIVKAHDLIDNECTNDDLKLKYRTTLDESMAVIMNNASAFYMILKDTIETDFTTQDHILIVDNIVEQFYRHTPSCLKAFSDDELLLKAWSILCSDIGRTY